MPREKGDIPIKNMPDVKDLGAELENSLEGFAKMDEAAQKVVQSVGGITDNLAKSNKWSAKNKKEASLLADASKAALKFAKSKSPEDKKALDAVKKQVMGNKNLSKEGKTQAKNLFNATGNVKEQESIQNKITGSIKEQAKGLVKSLTHMVSMAAVASMIWNTFKKWAGALGKIGGTFGVIGMKSEEFKSTLMGGRVEAQKIGKGLDNIVAVTDNLTTNFGYSLEEAAKISTSLIDTSKALAISDDEASSLFGTLTQITGLSADAAEDWMKTTALMAKANKVSPTAVLKDIAKSSETIAKFTGLTPKNIQKAAIMAKKLGTNLDKVGSIMEGLLDFQNSLTKEIEASIMLGREINFQRARELALANDLEGAMMEVVSQLGGEAAFMEMNALQRKALADALGTDVATMAQMITKQQEAKAINEEIAEQVPFEQMIGEEAMDGLAKLLANFQAMATTIMETMGPGIMKVVGFLGKVIQGVEKWIGIMPLLIGYMTTMVAKSIAGLVLQLAAASAGVAKWLGPAAIAWIPMIPIMVGGIVAAVAAIARSAGDVISPAKGTTMMSTKEGELLKLSKNDDVLAAPGLVDFMSSLTGKKAGDVVQTAQEGGLDLTSLTPAAVGGGEQMSNFIVNTNQNQTGVDAMKQQAAISDAMKPLFKELRDAVIQNTFVNEEIKELQENNPDAIGSQVADNMTYNRY